MVRKASCDVLDIVIASFPKNPEKTAEVFDILMELFTTAEARGRKEMLERVLKTVAEHHTSNTYEGDEQLVFHTTVNELVEALQILSSENK